MTVSIFLDTRAAGKRTPAPIKFAVRRKGQAAYIATGLKVLASQWNKSRNEVVGHPNAKMMNIVLAKKRVAIDSAVLQLIDDGEAARLSAFELRDKILEAIDPEAHSRIQEAKTFKYRFRRFMELKSNPGTRNLYAYTLQKLEVFDPKLEGKTFEDITKDYLQNFEAFCAKTQMRNGRNIYLRNIRAVFNDAIDAGITTAYPFRTFHLKQEATRKKALTPEQLRELLNTPCEPYQEQYRDIFMLMFLLRGINAGDLFLAKDSAVVNGRFEYRRNKTGTLFSVKIEPEAAALIEKYKGKKWLLNPLDSYKDYKDYAHHMNDALKAIGRPVAASTKAVRSGLFPDLSTNWARHTWATTALRIGIPKEVISKGLGHSFGLRVTDIYIDFDMSLVDDANRKVIDFIFYGKDYRLDI